MAFNINTFKSYMPDVAASANFYVRISNPRCFDGAGYSLEKMSFLCETAVHPAVRVMTDRNNRYNLSGTTYPTPYAAALEDSIPMMFYIPNDDPLPVKMFSFWIQQIAGVPNETLLTPSAGKGLIPGQVSYRDQYTSTISIFSLDRSNQNLIETTLFEAFPVNVNPIDLAWANEDYLRLQTQMAFSGIQTITYKQLSDGKYRREDNFGSSDYAAAAYSDKLNTIRDQLDSLTASSTIT
jgi:hypothetical protein